MKVLTAKGLVQARQRAGTKVRPARRVGPARSRCPVLARSRHHQRHPGRRPWSRLRQFLEPKAARLAAERATEDDIEAMQAAHHRLARAAADPAEFYAADIAFHLAVFAGCHNLLIQRLSGIVETVLTLSFRLQDSELVDPAGGGRSAPPGDRQDQVTGSRRRRTRHARRHRSRQGRTAAAHQNRRGAARCPVTRATEGFRINSIIQET